MATYNVQFGNEDVSNCLDEIMDRVVAFDGSENERIETLVNQIAILRHELMSPLTIVKGYMDILGLDEAASAETLATSLENMLTDFGNIESMRIKASEIPSLDPSCYELADKLREVVSGFPLEKTAEKHLRDMVGGLNSGAARLVYTWNMAFSTGMKTDEHYLTSQIHHFRLNTQPAFPIDVEFLHIDLVTKEDYFRNVIYQFMINAQQHAFNGVDPGKRAIKIALQPNPESKEVVVRFSDNGTGVKPELGNLFSPEVTTKPDSEKHGIGLWSVRKFVEENGGRIEYNSTSGKGTTFTFTIPYTRKEGLTYFG